MKCMTPSGAVCHTMQYTAKCLHHVMPHINPHMMQFPMLCTCSSTLVAMHKCKMCALICHTARVQNYGATCLKSLTPKCSVCYSCIHTFQPIVQSTVLCFHVSVGYMLYECIPRWYTLWHTMPCSCAMLGDIVYACSWDGHGVYSYMLRSIVFKLRLQVHDSHTSKSSEWWVVIPIPFTTTLMQVQCACSAHAVCMTLCSDSECNSITVITT